MVSKRIAKIFKRDETIEAVFVSKKETSDTLAISKAMKAFYLLQEKEQNIF